MKSNHMRASWQSSSATLTHNETVPRPIGPVTQLDGKEQLHYEVVILTGWIRQKRHVVAFLNCQLKS